MKQKFVIQYASILACLCGAILKAPNVTPFDPKDLVNASTYADVIAAFSKNATVTLPALTASADVTIDFSMDSAASSPFSMMIEVADEYFIPLFNNPYSATYPSVQFDAAVMQYLEKKWTTGVRCIVAMFDTTTNVFIGQATTLQAADQIEACVILVSKGNGKVISASLVPLKDTLVFVDSDPNSQGLTDGQVISKKEFKALKNVTSGATELKLYPSSLTTKALTKQTSSYPYVFDMVAQSSAHQPTSGGLKFGAIQKAAKSGGYAAVQALAGFTLPALVKKIRPDMHYYIKHAAANSNNTPDFIKFTFNNAMSLYFYHNIQASANSNVSPSVPLPTGTELTAVNAALLNKGIRLVMFMLDKSKKFVPGDATVTPSDQNSIVVMMFDLVTGNFLYSFDSQQSTNYFCDADSGASLNTVDWTNFLKVNDAFMTVGYDAQGNIIKTNFTAYPYVADLILDHKAGVKEPVKRKPTTGASVSDVLGLVKSMKRK